MIIIEHSTVDENSIAENLGLPEYSYWFVRKAFRRVLGQFGVTVGVTDPTREVDRIHHSAKAHGIESVFLSFNPPHLLPVGLDCPMAPVFAWEFDTIPNEVWQNEPRNDWATVLSSLPAAVTHCSFSADAVRRELGANYPIWSIPAPVFESNATRAFSARGWRDSFEIVLSRGVAIDSQAIDLALFRPDRPEGHGYKALRLLDVAAQTPRPALRLSLRGVIYNAVFNPVDDRKNWTDMIAGFVAAFRNQADATLILKITHHSLVDGVLPILNHLSRLGDFACRVILVHGMLADDEYSGLVEATSFAVNTSNGEGQCLPLMEFMSAGRPAVAPRHTAMLDYVNADNSFIVSSGMRQTHWPHDSRRVVRCLRHEISVADLVRQFRASFVVARDDPDRYRSMSAAATQTLRAYCSDAVVSERLSSLLAHMGLGGKSDAATERRRQRPAARV
jgi:glycosyltransferase involved in cell wall biosynthesis